MKDHWVQSPAGLVIIGLGLVCIVLEGVILSRLRNRHTAAWRKEVRSSDTIARLRFGDQWRLFGFFMTGEYRSLGDQVLRNLVVWQRVVFGLALMAGLWLVITQNGGKW